MSEYQMGSVESRFADIIWNNEPISTVELCVLTEKELNWKKTTTYTVLKRLCEKGIFRNDKGNVTSVISKEKLRSYRCEQFVNETFGGSLPAFLAAFADGKKLTPEEIESLRNIIEKYGEE